MSGRLRVFLTMLAVVALLYSVVTLVIQALPLSNVIDLVVAVGSPYVPLVALSGWRCQYFPSWLCIR